MKFKLFAGPLSLTFGAAILTLVSAVPSFAQEEGALTVLDEPVAQVNNDVIMLSDLRREMSRAREALVQQRGMTEQQAEVEVQKRQAEMIVSLISEQLLLQRGRDMGLAEDIEAEVNREMLRVANGSGMKTITQLEEAMRREGLSPDEVRQSLRRGYMREAVFGREVDYKIYNAITLDEAQKFHAANRDKFHSVTISEIMLSVAGRPTEEVRKRAAELAAQARGGADFGALAEKHSEREVNGVRTGPQNKGRVEEADGKLRRLFLSELSPEVSKALKPLKTGGVSEPVLLDDGFYIFKVHETDDSFNETHVRNIMTLERRQKEREAYIPKLRKEAYVKVATDYEAAVLPLLNLKTEAAPAKIESSEKKPQDKKPEKQ